ncbi:hypothetical protein DAI22_03g018750 [Oryza sativa Japonica Group]|nr:hypothetical protein DAI22_03g018750 [Oryza sativa Japonica Group]
MSVKQLSLPFSPFSPFPLAYDAGWRIDATPLGSPGGRGKPPTLDASSSYELTGDDEGQRCPSCGVGGREEARGHAGELRVRQAWEDVAQQRHDRAGMRRVGGVSSSASPAGHSRASPSPTADGGVVESISVRAFRGFGFDHRGPAWLCPARRRRVAMPPRRPSLAALLPRVDPPSPGRPHEGGGEVGELGQH